MSDDELEGLRWRISKVYEGRVMHFIIIKHDCAPVCADEAVSDELDVICRRQYVYYCLSRGVYTVYI